MKACARAPVRVDPAGGGTDAPPFSVEHGGMVVNFAVSHYAYASVDRLPAGEGVTIWSEDLQSGVTAESTGDLPPESLAFLQGFVRRLADPEDSLLLVTESDVPAGAGLGGSGALGVAVVAAIDRAYGRQRSPAETARLANQIERVDLGLAGGDQDSFGAALGGFKQLEYVKGGGTVPQQLKVSDAFRLQLEQNSLLVYTGEAHISSRIHEDIKRSYALPDSPTIAAMVDLREAAKRMSAALQHDDFDVFCQTMNASCDALYRLHESCDSDAHRQMCERLGDLIAARKTCGAGGGGFIFFVSRPGRRRQAVRVAEELGALVWPLHIDAAGVQSWSANPTSDLDVSAYRRLALD